MKENFSPFGVPGPTFEPSPYVVQSRSRIRIAAVSLGVLVFGVIAAMALVPIGGAVIASGQVAPESRVKQIAHLTGGIVSQIAVHDGDRVRQGQVLLRLDTSVSSVDAELSGQSLDQLLAQRARLEAELTFDLLARHLAKLQVIQVERQDGVIVRGLARLVLAL